MTCDKCKAGPLSVAYMCDESMDTLCVICFHSAECYMEPHEEGCMTVVFDDLGVAA